LRAEFIFAISDFLSASLASGIVLLKDANQIVARITRIVVTTMSSTRVNALASMESSIWCVRIFLNIFIIYKYRNSNEKLKKKKCFFDLKREIDIILVVIKINI